MSGEQTISSPFSDSIIARQYSIQTIFSRGLAVLSGRLERTNQRFELGPPRNMNIALDKYVYKANSSLTSMTLKPN